jgi:hypothetical protein
MKNNQFSKDELAQMKSFYQNEYNQLLLKIKHVVEVLKKLEPVAFSDEIAIVDIKMPVKKALVKTEVRKGKRGPGRPKKSVAEVVPVKKEKVAAPIKEVKATPKKITPKKVAAKKVATKKVTKPKEVATANVAAVKEPKPKKVVKKVIKKVTPKVKKVKAVVKAKPKVKPAKKGKFLKKPIKSGTGDSKVKWNDFIVNALLQEEKPFLLSNFTQRAVSELNIPAEDSERAKMAIAGTLTRITKAGNEIKTYKKQGQKGSFYVLSTWLDESGNLKPEYVNKI